MLEVGLQGLKSSFKFLIGIDIGIGEEDAYSEILSKIYQRIDRTYATADVDQKFWSAFELA